MGGLINKEKKKPGFRYKIRDLPDRSTAINYKDSGLGLPWNLKTIKFQKCGHKTFGAEFYENGCIV